jgi:hypothetical protein
MSKARIEYSRLVEDALRTVVRDVLSDAARDGISSPHHFYITFKTVHPGVELPEFLVQRYPSEMTIVLQYQFWDLEVHDDQFMVTLSFNDTLHRLVIPFSAIKVFADPGVEFGLQFTLEADEDEPDKEGTEIGAAIDSLEGTTEGTTPTPLPRPQPRAVSGDKSDNEQEIAKAGAEIVTLDRFRKK